MKAEAPVPSSAIASRWRTGWRAGRGEEGEHGGQQRAGEHSRREAERVAAAVVRHREGDDRRHQHHPFDAQVDHAGALVDEDADGRQQHRRASAMLAAASVATVSI